YLAAVAEAICRLVRSRPTSRMTSATVPQSPFVAVARGSFITSPPHRLEAMAVTACPSSGKPGVRSIGRGTVGVLVVCIGTRQALESSSCRCPLLGRHELVNHVEDTLKQASNRGDVDPRRVLLREASHEIDDAPQLTQGAERGACVTGGLG